MKQSNLIIELPHLQSLPQRIGSLFVGLCCWILWIYFLFPLIFLTGWLLGVRTFSAEVRWFGGYKSLIELLQMYGLTVLAILGVWLAVTLLRELLPRDGTRRSPQTPPTGGSSFTTPSLSISDAPSLRSVTVHFDPEGRITEITPLEIRKAAP